MAGGNQERAQSHGSRAHLHLTGLARPSRAGPPAAGRCAGPDGRGPPRAGARRPATPCSPPARQTPARRAPRRRPACRSSARPAGARSHAPRAPHRCGSSPSEGRRRGAGFTGSAAPRCRPPPASPDRPARHRSTLRRSRPGPRRHVPAAPTRRRSRSAQAPGWLAPLRATIPTSSSVARDAGKTGGSAHDRLVVGRGIVAFGGQAGEKPSMRATLPSRSCRSSIRLASASSSPRHRSRGQARSISPCKLVGLSPQRRFHRLVGRFPARRQILETGQRRAKTGLVQHREPPCARPQHQAGATIGALEGSAFVAGRLVEMLLVRRQLLEGIRRAQLVLGEGKLLERRLAAIGTPPLATGSAPGRRPRRPRIPRHRPPVAAPATPAVIDRARRCRSPRSTRARGGGRTPPLPPPRPAQTPRPRRRP